MAANKTPPVRCSKYKLLPLADLVPHPDNPNTHPARQIELLVKIITAQGWRSPIVVSKRSGYVVSGHARLMAATDMGCAKVPVDVQEFATEEEEYAHLVADNRIAEIADLDFEGISAILKRLDGEIDLDLTGFLDFEREPLLEGEWNPPPLDDFPLPDMGKPIHVTEEQREVFMRAADKVRADTDDQTITEGRCVELLAADYLAG